MARSLILEGKVTKKPTKEVAVKQDKLLKLVTDYISKKDVFDSMKAEVDTLNKEIKTQMNERSIDSYESELGSVILADSVSVSFDEKHLLEWLKVNHPNCIKVVETVDMEQLENATYHGDIKPTELQPFQQRKVVQRLTIKVKKNGK